MGNPASGTLGVHVCGDEGSIAIGAYWRDALVRLVPFLLFVALMVPSPAVHSALLTAAYGHTCAVTPAGRLKCWGANGNAQLGDGTWDDRLSAIDVVGLDVGVRDVSAAGDYTCALTATGGIKCWGVNNNGQLGDGTRNGRENPVDVNGLAAGVAEIAAGFDHTCALLDSGGVRCWGSNWYGQLGDGTTTDRLTAVDVDGLGAGVVAIDAASSMTCALTIDGAVKCWGFNGGGALGDGTTTRRLTPTDVSGLNSGVTAISVDGNGSCALLASGMVKCWGGGQLTPVSVATLESGVAAIAVGGTHRCAVRDSGIVECWGDNDLGQLGDGTAMPHAQPAPVVGLLGHVMEIALGYHHGCARLETGVIQCWGDSLYGELGDGSSTRHAEPVDVVAADMPFTQIAGGFMHHCALTVSGSVFCWGSNDFGALGNGTAEQSPVPVEVSQLEEPVTDVIAGAAFGCAATASGRAKCWGIPGVAGNPTAADVPGLQDDIEQLAVGSQSQHACAITQGGALKCWGRNYEGQLGDGTTIDSDSAVGVTGMESDVTEAAVGADFTCALTTAGAVKCWGANNSGQLGDGSIVPHAAPGGVVGLGEGVIAISAGRNHACALMADGGMKCWGDNTTGKLGDGSQQQQLQPVDVMSYGEFLEQVEAISAGDDQTCVVTTTGAARCWGWNFYGQLGNGTYWPGQATTQNAVGLETGVIGIAAAHEHTCAVTQSGIAKCWGYNQNGQLGNGEAGPLTPRTVVGTPFDDALFNDGFESAASG